MDPDPDPLVGTDPRIRIRTKMSRIPNTGNKVIPDYLLCPARVHDKVDEPGHTLQNITQNLYSKSVINVSHILKIS